jgi:hypothetical protein
VSSSAERDDLVARFWFSPGLGAGPQEGQKAMHQNVTGSTLTAIIK